MAKLKRTKWPTCRDYIKLKVLRADDSDDTVGHFMIKKKCSFSKLMDSYCKTHELVKRTVRFRFDGEKIKEADTPSSLKLRNGDIIEVFIMKTDGWFYY